MHSLGGARLLLKRVVSSIPNDRVDTSCDTEAFKFSLVPQCLQCSAVSMTVNVRSWFLINKCISVVKLGGWVDAPGWAGEISQLVGELNQLVLRLYSVSSSCCTWALKDDQHYHKSHLQIKKFKE